MAGNRRISLRQLKEHLSYDAATGIFRWKSRVRGRSVGSVAYCAAAKKYFGEFARAA